DGHSETKGKAKEPQRVLINFMVDDLDAEQQRLEGLGVPFIRDKGREPWGGRVSTFLDPDGHHLQLIADKGDRAGGGGPAVTPGARRRTAVPRAGAGSAPRRRGVSAASAADCGSGSSGRQSAPAPRSAGCS